MSPFRSWLFVDTLHVLDGTKAELEGACLKLQCLFSQIAAPGELRAHRALDDCLALRDVVHSVACRLDCSVTSLLCKLAFRWDEPASRAQVAKLIAD